MKNKLSDKEKLQKRLEWTDQNASFEEIIMNFIDANPEDFPAYRITYLMKELLEYFAIPKVKTLENIKAISRERALYLKTYLEGDMYTTKEAAIEAIPIQIKNAQRIMDVCDGKDFR